jgi:hypothetical protein
MKKDNKPNTDKTPPLNEMANLDTCTQAPEFAEHARPNEPPREPCDDGRAGTRIYDKQIKEVNDMTEDKQKSEQCEDIVKERNEERQHTMDKMSVDTSEVHTYDKNRADDSEKCL